MIVQGLADHVAAQLWRVLVFPDHLDRFVERGQFDSAAHGVLEQVSLPGVWTAPALRAITVNDGKQEVVLLNDRWFHYLEKNAPVLLGNGRLDLLRVAPNPIGQFMVEFRKMSGRRPDRDGQIGRSVTVEVTGDEILWEARFNEYSLAVNALDHFLRLGRLRWP